MSLDARKGIDFIGVTVVFFCHDGQGRILLHKRSQNCRDEWGRWDCGGGSMEHGETFEEAVAREVQEEYGVVPISIEYVETKNVLRTHDGQATHWVANLHVVEVNPEDVIIGEPEKMEELGWFSPDEFPEECHSMLRPHFACVADHLSKKK